MNAADLGAILDDITPNLDEAERMYSEGQRFYRSSRGMEQLGEAEIQRYVDGYEQGWKDAIETVYLAFKDNEDI